MNAPALAVNDEARQAVALALERIENPTNDDRTAGLAAIHNALHVPSARLAWLARVAIEAMRARRHEQTRNTKRSCP